jgi:hypothetical protein
MALRKPLMLMRWRATLCQVEGRGTDGEQRSTGQRLVDAWRPNVRGNAARGGRRCKAGMRA